MQDDRLQNGQSIIHPSIRFDFTLTPADFIFYFESVNKSQTGAKKKKINHGCFVFFLGEQQANRTTGAKAAEQTRGFFFFPPPRHDWKFMSRNSTETLVVKDLCVGCS